MKRFLTYLALAGCLLALAPMLLCLAGLCSRAEVCTSTGDFRYRFLGLTYRTIPQPSSVRPIIARAAELSPPLAPEWLLCDDLGANGGGRGGRRVYYSYQEAVPWAEVDLMIVRLIIDDIIAWVRETEGRMGLPASCVMFQGLETADDGALAVRPDWREVRVVGDYLAKRGYAAERAEEGKWRVVPAGQGTSAGRDPRVPSRWRQAL